MKEENKTMEYRKCKYCGTIFERSAYDFREKVCGKCTERLLEQRNYINNYEE